MQITALKAAPRRPRHILVYLDGRYAFTLMAVTAARLHLGQTLDEAAVDRLQADDARERAYARMLAWLAARPRTEAEVRRKLARCQLPADAAEEVLGRLRDAGLVDDRAFARAWVENRAAFRPRSRRILQAELKRKGLTAEAAAEALAGVDDAEAAYQLARRRLRSTGLRQMPYAEFRRKVGDYLVRHGFDYDTAAAIGERLWQEQQNPETDS